MKTSCPFQKEVETTGNPAWTSYPKPSAKLVCLLRHFLWSHREALNNEHQDAGKHPCSLQIKTLSQKEPELRFSAQNIKFLLCYLQNILIVWKQELHSLPSGKALGLSTTSWCHFSRRPRKPAATLPSWANTGTSWYGKTKKSDGQLFPCPSLALCPGMMKINYTCTCSCEQEQGRNCLCTMYDKDTN